MGQRATRILRRYLETPIGQAPGDLVRDVRKTLGMSDAVPPTPPAPDGPAAVDPPTVPSIAYADRLGYSPCAVLSVDPPILLTGIAFRESVGIVGAFGRRFPGLPAAFIIYPTWTIAGAAKAAVVVAAARTHQERYPHHRLVFACNTADERDRLAAGGLSALILNKNSFVPEQTFRPLDGVGVEFDAVYNARFLSFKRHHLAGHIGRMAYVAYPDPPSTAETRSEQRTLLTETLGHHPDHVLINPAVDGLPVRLPLDEVNVALNRAAVGLCLSAHEGANRASMEYLLAGVPVVSTPSIGGREVYFDPEYCTICDPDPDAVRDAVEDLRTRHIPRAYIRERTLAKIEPDRRRFLTLIDELREELGGERQHDDGVWPFSSLDELVSWDEHWRHLDHFEKARHPDRGRRREPEATIREALAGTGDVQMHVTELRPIVEAISAAPHCALLVFGCGNDSVFWERINRDGTTVFLEDDPTWAADVSARLDRSAVHLVEYDTVMTEWQGLLHAPERLAMELPDEVATRRFDVVVVDAPAGYERHLELTGREAPGRMQSIYVAAQLVAPGGTVFVHDCDRVIEQTYATEYLGGDRLFVRAEGRSMLQGYQF
jgi:hypothetical protein